MAKKDALRLTILNDLVSKKPTKSERTRLQIVEAAIKSYAKVGIDSITNETIAIQAGVTRPLVQHYFPNKKDLFLFAIQCIRAEFQEKAVRAIGEARDPEEMLKRYVRATFEWIETAPDDSRAWLFYLYGCTNDRTMREKHLELTKIGESRIVEMLKFGVKAGVFENGDLPKKARGIQKLITGGLLEATTEWERDDVSRICAEVTELCMKIVRKGV